MIMGISPETKIRMVTERVLLYMLAKGAVNYFPKYGNINQEKLTHTIMQDIVTAKQ